MRRRIFFSILIIVLLFTHLCYAKANSSIPVSSLMTSEAAGKVGKQASTSVLRVICALKNRMGTGFLHKSGNVITAAHVVEGCNNSDISLITPTGDSIKVDNVISDSKLDLSLIKPEGKIISESLIISSAEKLTIGSQVTTWGYPFGYLGKLPLLTVGYLSGNDFVTGNDGKMRERWVINAAFNSGNSGGPLLKIDDGTVIGVVSSKLAPLPDYLEQAIKVMSENKKGVQYNKTRPDGTVEKISESQLIAQLLNYFQSQTQLVIGHAIKLGDIREFLTNNSIEP